jgi:hypothetical protein
MTKTKSVLLLAAALITSSGAPAAAQTTKNIFLDVNFGVQTGSQSFAGGPIVQPAYDETVITSFTQEYKSGPLFDISGGVRVWRDLSIGLGFSRTTGKGDAAVTSAVPSPIFHDRRVTVTNTVADLKHTETAVNILVGWTVPVTDKIDATFSFGPSFLNGKQELVNGVTVPAGTQGATPTVAEESKGGTGYNVGADVSYLVNPRLGFGGFVRYVGGTVDLPSVPDVKLGGFQVGVGLRIRM